MPAHVETPRRESVRSTLISALEPHWIGTQSPPDPWLELGGSDSPAKTVEMVLSLVFVPPAWIRASQP